MTATTEERNDAALVEAARRGDKAAFGELVAHHRPLLLAICRRALADDELAADAAQEAVLQALLALDRVRHPERFGSWLAGIGLNVCHRLRRQRSRDAWSWDALLGGRIVAEPRDPDPGPAAFAEAADLRRRIDRAVAGLPPGQRAAVVLHYLEGLTQAETALLLGIEVGTVKTRLHKARSNLRKSLWTEFAEIAKEKGEEPAMTMIEMRVADVRRRAGEDEPSARHVVILEEVGGERRLPIWVGEAEATALAVQLERIAVPRPLTYAFAAEVLRAAGGHLREVRVDRLEEEVYYATAVVAGPDGEQTVDARPSDALNLAVLLGAPIRVAAGVLAVTASDAAREERARLDEYTDGAAAIAAAVTADWSQSSCEPVGESETA